MSKGKVLVIGSNATRIEIQGGKTGPTGQYLNETVVPMLALKDAGISYDMIQQAYVGYVYGDSTSGQRALYQVGMSGIPIINVNNNCATGSTALFLARQAVASGAVECALAVGFEQMNPGPLIKMFMDRPIPTDLVAGTLEKTAGIDRSAQTPRNPRRHARHRGAARQSAPAAA